MYVYKPIVFYEINVHSEKTPQKTFYFLIFYALLMIVCLERSSYFMYCMIIMHITHILIKYFIYNTRSKLPSIYVSKLGQTQYYITHMIKLNIFIPVLKSEIKAIFVVVFNTFIIVNIFLNVKWVILIEVILFAL